MSYSREVLDTFITSGEAKLVGELPPLKKEAKINFQCKFGKEDTKVFVRIKISGMFCKSCIKKDTQTRREATNLEKYGTTCALQSESVKKKAVETCMKKYGAENVFKSKEILEKIKKTNLEKYGAENPFASKEIITKLRAKAVETYGTEFPMQNETVKAKTKATNLKKYGVEVTSKAESVKQKARETNLAIYGSESHTSAPSVVAKKIATNLVKYGVEHSFQADSVKEKSKKTLLARYGVEYNMQSTEIRDNALQTRLEHYGPDHPEEARKLVERREATCMKRFGVRNINQSLEIQSKSQKTGYTYKDYTTPSGIIRKVQGYEPFALDILFKTEHQDESNIITDRIEVPRIAYTKEDDSDHYYFPDIFIKSEKKLIEVKSTWTYSLHLETNQCKWKAAQAAGYTMEFWVFGSKGERTVITVPSMVSPFLTMEEPEDV